MSRLATLAYKLGSWAPTRNSGESPTKPITVDSYNLSWKLIHSLHGLTPANKSGDVILDTFETERHTIAQELIAFDKEFSSMFSGKIGAGDSQGSLTHEQFLEVFSTGNGFTSGCGIEYPENILVKKADSEMVVHGTDYLSGVLRPGRRLLSVRVKRHADGVRRDLQDGQHFPYRFYLSH